MRFVFCIIILLFGFDCAIAQNCKQCNYWLGKVDPKLNCSLTESSEPQLSDQEILDLMSCLIKNQGRKQKANTLTASRSSKISQTFDSPTIEVASLYYISYLFIGNVDFASAIAFETSDEGEINSPKSIRVAYKSYKRWLKKVKMIGLSEARRQKLNPLDGTDVNWY